MSVNFGKICRLCMKEAEKLLPMFCQDENLPERVMSLSPGVKVSGRTSEVDRSNYFY